MFKILFKAVLGSRAYGTHNQNSDYDYRGVGVQTGLEYYFGTKRSKQQQGDKGEDITIYSIQQFFGLAAKGNPNILEIMYQDNENLIEVTTPEWTDIVVPNREIFLSKEVKHAYKGYATAQYDRMKRHHQWLLNPPKEPNVHDYFYKPSEKWEMYKNIYMDYDLEKPENKNRIINFIDSISDPSISNKILLVKYHGRNITMRMKEKNIEKQGMLFDKEKYENDLKDYNSYVEKRSNRNAARYALEEKYGYDTKHASHTIRLVDQAEDVLLHKKLRLCRPDRVQLWRDIREGKMSFNDFAAIYDKGIENLETWAENSTLPDSPDRDKIEKILIDLVRASVEL